MYVTLLCSALPTSYRGSEIELEGGGRGEGEATEVGEDETDAPTSLETVLARLGMSELEGVFAKEEIDFDSLVSPTAPHHTVCITCTLYVEIAM